MLLQIVRRWLVHLVQACSEIIWWDKLRIVNVGWVNKRKLSDVLQCLSIALEMCTRLWMLLGLFIRVFHLFSSLGNLQCHHSYQNIYDRNIDFMCCLIFSILSWNRLEVVLVKRSSFKQKSEFFTLFVVMFYILFSEHFKNIA